MCRDTMLLKTLIIPIINFNNSIDYRIKDGQLKEVNNENRTYTLLSKDSILSTITTLFGRSIQVVGRSCVIATNVSSSSTPTNNFLVEQYSFRFQGELIMTENCPVNGKIISVDWKFYNTANFTLPLSCSLNSSLINCGSVNLYSAGSRKITLKETRMQIIKRTNIEQKRQHGKRKISQ